MDKLIDIRKSGGAGSIRVRNRGLKKTQPHPESPIKNHLIRAAIHSHRRDSFFDEQNKENDQESIEGDQSPTKLRMRNKHVTNFRPESYVREGITREEVVEFKAAFDLFDADGGGTIDPYEMIDAMKDLAVPMKDGIIEEFFKKKRTDGTNGFVKSDEISFDEMINMMTINNKDETRQELQEVFTMFDVYNRGYIDLETLREVASQMGEAVQEGDLEQMIVKAARNGDGKVYFDDFYYLIKYLD